MIIKILGSGGAFSRKYGNTMMYLDSGDPETSLLFDCGETFLHNCTKTGFDVKNIRNIYISHTHTDHIGGLATLGLMCYFYPEYKTPNLFTKRGIAKLLWKNYLALMLETLADGQLPRGKSEATFEDYFNIQKLSSNESFMLGESECRPVQTIHVVNGSDFMESYGLMITLPEDKQLFITGDTQFAPNQLMLNYEKADVIINDCETSPLRSGVHAPLEDLKTLSDDIKKKMYLIHYGDTIDRENAKKICDEHGFAGFLFQGDMLEI